MSAIDRSGPCWWMSFADSSRPRGAQFLGVVILFAKDPKDAVDRAWALGINPGGEVLLWVTDTSDIPEGCFERLLSRADLEAAGMEVVPIGEKEDER